MEQTAVINPKTGKLAVSKFDALQTTLNYSRETLSNNQAAEHEVVGNR